MKDVLTIVAAILAVSIIIQVVRIVDSAGMLTSIEPHFAGECSSITGVTGAEDITIDPLSHYAYISSTDRRAAAANNPIQGGIFGLDLTDATKKPVHLTADFTASFHPHGISLYKGKSRDSLFVINHLERGVSQVEVFDIEATGKLTHRSSINYPQMVSPNDLVAVGPNQFYATNDHGNPPGFMQTLEDYLTIPLSNVTYFDVDGGRVVATGFRYANGITVSRDGTRIYVAETTGRKVGIFSRNPETGALSKISDVELNSGADNLEWDQQGNLWIAGHPRMFDFLAHASNEDEKSPSQVLRIDVDAEPPVVSEIFLDDGTAISGSSVAAVFKEIMLIGSVFERKILRCTRPATSY